MNARKLSHLVAKAEQQGLRLFTGPEAKPSTTPIDKINATPMDELRFRDFNRLKSGRDEFSRLKLDALRERVSIGAVREVETVFADADQQAKCLRWMLRGLTPDKAMRKVMTDAEVSENARGQKLAMRNHPLAHKF